MAFKIIYSSGKTLAGSSGYGFVQMHPEMDNLSRILGEVIKGNIYAEEAGGLGWPSPPQIATHRIVPEGGIDWHVLSRTRPITEAQGRAYFITEYIVCDPEEVRSLAEKNITPADILLTRDQSDLWFVGGRWDQPARYFTKPLEFVKPGQKYNPTKNLVIQLPAEPDSPSLWSQLASKPGDGNTPLFPFQYGKCCWLADRKQKFAEKGDDGGKATILDPDGLLGLFNESGRALAGIGAQLEEDPAKKSQWLQSPWKITFTTFALERDHSIDYEWLGCWKDVDRQRSYLGEAESKKNLLNLGSLGRLDPDRLQENLLQKRWIPGGEEPEPQAEPGATQSPTAPIPARSAEPAQETAIPVGALAKTDGPAGVKSLLERSRERAIEKKKLWKPVGLALGGSLLVLLLFLGFWNIKNASREKAVVEELQDYFNDLSTQVKRCETQIVNEKRGFADYDSLKEFVRAGDVSNPGMKALESLLEEIPSPSGADENESDEIRGLRDQISDKEKEAREWVAVCDDYDEWKGKLDSWALTETIDPGSVPATLGRHPTNKDDLRIRAVVRAANRVIEADDAKALGTEGETSLQTTLRNSVAGAGRPFQEVLEKIEENAQELARTKIGSWKEGLIKEADEAFAAADETELTNVLNLADALGDALAKGAGEWMEPNDGSPLPGRNQWLTEWKDKLDKEVPVDGSANDQRERHQKLLVFLKGQPVVGGVPEGFAAGLADIGKHLKVDEPKSAPPSVEEGEVPLVLNSGSAEEIRFELPIPEGFDLKRIQFIRPNFANFSVDTTTIDGPDSIFVPYTPEEIPGQDESWQRLRYTRETGTVRLVGKKDFSLFGSLKRDEGNGFATFAVAKENAGLFKTDYAILEVGAIEGAVQPNPEVAETNAKPRFFLLGKEKDFVLNDLPADRFFEGRKNEEDPGNELCIEFDSQADWNLKILVDGIPDTLKVERLASVRTKLGEVVKKVADGKASKAKLRENFAARGAQCVENFKKSLLEVDLFTGVKRLRVEIKKEWRGEGVNRHQVDVEILTLADDYPGYSYRMFLKGERNPFGDKQGLGRGYSSDYSKTLLSYGKNSMEAYLALSSEDEEIEENEVDSKAKERIFYISYNDKKRWNDILGRVSGLDNFEEFFGLPRKGGEGSGGKARVQNSRSFVLQWQNFASLLSQEDTKKFFEIERGFPDRNLANPDADLDKIQGRQEITGGGGPGITPEMLMEALKSPYEKLNELVNLAKLQLETKKQ